MSKKIFFVVGLIAVLGISSSLVYGQRGDRDRGRESNYNGGNYDARDTASMTKNQLKQYDALYEKYSPRMDKIIKAMGIQTDIITVERVKAEPDMAKINKAIDAESMLMAELNKIRIEYSIEIDRLFPKNRNR